MRICSFTYLKYKQCLLFPQAVDAVSLFFKAVSLQSTINIFHTNSPFLWETFYLDHYCWLFDLLTAVFVFLCAFHIIVLIARPLFFHSFTLLKQILLISTQPRVDLYHCGSIRSSFNTAVYMSAVWRGPLTLLV